MKNNVFSCIKSKCVVMDLAIYTEQVKMNWLLSAFEVV